MKTKTLFTSLAVMVSALANAAPSVGYQAATNIAEYAASQATNALAAVKQDALVSGENIKTVNGQTLLGSGNIEIAGGGGGDTTEKDVAEVITNHVTSGYLATQTDVSTASAQTLASAVAESAKMTNDLSRNGMSFYDIESISRSKLTADGFKTDSSFTYKSDGNSLVINDTNVNLDSPGDLTFGQGSNTNLQDLLDEKSNADSVYTMTQSDALYAPTSTAVTVSSHTSQLSQQSQQIAAIGAHLNAEDAHFVSTNYDSVVNLPEAFVEIKMNGSWITIWREMKRWTTFVGDAFDWNGWGGFHAWMTNVTQQLSFKADRCWGIYDSETGGYSPDGFTQISSSNILIAANMAYQKTVTSRGSVWVLQCNSGTAHIGGDTNGFFRIKDGDGVTQFEIIKGNKQELGADAEGITVDNSTTQPTVTIQYSVEASEHPTLQICGDLVDAQWKAETDANCIANVSWSGSSGDYVATVQRKTAGDALFVKASYMSGGETYIRNVAPVGMDAIMLNGTKYYLGTNVISGVTVLTLSTTPPNQ